MTPEEREQYKTLLAKANEESRAEIARRQEQIAADPLGFNQVQLRDRRARDGEEGPSSRATDAFSQRATARAAFCTAAARKNSQQRPPQRAMN